MWKSCIPLCCFSMPYRNSLWKVCELWKNFSVWTLPTALLAALLHGATAAFLFLWRGGRTVEHALGTLVLSGMCQQICWSRQRCPVLRQKMVVCRGLSMYSTGSFQLSGTRWNVSFIMFFSSEGDGKGLGQVQSWLRTVLLIGGKIGWMCNQLDEDQSLLDPCASGYECKRSPSSWKSETTPAL